MRCYIITISFMIIFNELEWTSVLRDSPVVQRYGGRGLCYTFVGVLGDTMHDIGNDYNDVTYSYTNEEGYVTIAVPTFETFAEVFIRVAAISLFVGGVIYILMGMMLLQGKVNRDVEEYHRRLDIANTANAKVVSTVGAKV